MAPELRGADPLWHPRRSSRFSLDKTPSYRRYRTGSGPVAFPKRAWFGSRVQKPVLLHSRSTTPCLKRRKGACRSVQKAGLGARVGGYRMEPVQNPTDGCRNAKARVRRAPKWCCCDRTELVKPGVQRCVCTPYDRRTAAWLRLKLPREKRDGP